MSAKAKVTKAQAPKAEAKVEVKDQAKTTTAATNVFGDMFVTQNDHMDAFVQAGNVWASAAEDLGKAYMSFFQFAGEQQVETAKTLMAVTDMQDLADVQTKLVRDNFDGLVAESTKLSELTLKVANEASEPLQAQAAKLGFDKIWKPIAA